jgi:hypothetical protein
VLALWGATLSGCGAKDPGGESLAEEPPSLQTQQIDPGGIDYVIYTLTQDAATIGQVLVTNTAGDGYAANTEYWYMAAPVSNNQALTFAGGRALSWSLPPPGLGTLSFTTARTPTWTLGTSVRIMNVYQDPNGAEYDGIDWQMTETSGAWSGQITWWSDATGNLFGPDVSRTLVPTRTHGTHYYCVSTPL